MEIFKNELFGEVRTRIGESGEILFVATDIAKALGYKRPHDAISKHCKYGTVKRSIIRDNLNRPQNAVLIPESDMYRLIIKSRNKQAERFECWVMEEVLPSLRKNGGYIVGQEQMSQIELLNKSIDVANKIISERENEIERLLENSMQLTHKDKLESTKEICYPFLEMRGFDKKDIPKIHKLIAKRAWGKYENFSKSKPIDHDDYKHYLTIMEDYAKKLPRQINIFEFIEQT